MREETTRTKVEETSANRACFKGIGRMRDGPYLIIQHADSCTAIRITVGLAFD